jgi:hypothetical protein
MKHQELISYLQQVRDILGQRTTETDKFWDSLAKREPSDDEILRFLTISTSSDQWPQAGFAYTSPFEALTNLPDADRAVICNEFRRLLKSVSEYH